MADKVDEMTFWDHLDELRGTLIRSFAAVLVLTSIGLVFRDWLFAVIMAPTKTGFFIHSFLRLPQDIDVVNLEISGQFMTHLRASLMLGFVASFPYILWELWKFIAPALYDKEKRGVRKAFLLSSGLFYCGVAVGYFILLPVCLAFFQGYTVSDSVLNQFSLSSYMSMFFSMVVLIGIVFEFPVLIMILSSMGILTAGTLKSGRKYAFVVILILSALVTPADIGSMIIVAVPLYALYELSILLSKTDKSDINQ